VNARVAQVSVCKLWRESQKKINNNGIIGILIDHSSNSLIVKSQVMIMPKIFSNLANEKGATNIPFVSLLALLGLFVYSQVSVVSVELPGLLRNLLAH
jgi:hypothetical protein